MMMASGNTDGGGSGPTVTWDPTRGADTVDYSNDNLTAEHNGSVSSKRNLLASVGRTSGKWYWEVVVDHRENYFLIVGVTDADYNFESDIGAFQDGFGYVGGNGNRYIEGSYGSYGDSFSDGDVIGVAMNLDDGEIEFYKNGVSQGVRSAGYTPGHEYWPAVTLYPDLDQVTARFAASDFSYAVPAGFSAYA